MSATERRKGQRSELEVVHILQAHGWPHAHRTDQGLRQSQKHRGDIAGGPEGVHIECKRHERLNVPKALDQCMADAHELDIPVLVHRPSRHEWMATLKLEDLLPLLALKEKGL